MAAVLSVRLTRWPWLLLCAGRCFAAELAFPSELAASASSSASPHQLTADQVPFGNGYGFATRGLNGGIPGPTLRFDPGDTLYVNLTNHLDAANNVGCGTTGSEYCKTATTNLHTHGLHISSKGMSDGLSYYSDDIFAEIAPGGSAPYQFSIPDYHMGGTHWYHPHHHHATALQAGGGMAGVIIVADPANYLPTAYSSMVEKVVFISGHNLVTLQAMALSSQSTLMETAETDASANDLDTNVFLVNGQVSPTVSLSSHTWYRFRLVYAAVEQALQLIVTGDATCTLALLAKDGIYLSTLPRYISTVYLYPGARADVGVSCTCASYPCSGTLSSGPDRRLQPGRQGPGNAGADMAAADVLNISITETAGGSTTTLPTVSLERPCYLADLQSATVDAGNSGALDLDGGGRQVRWNGAGTSMTHANVEGNGDGTMSTWPALTAFTAGTVHEMVVTGANAHPLHIHVNPYQVTSMPAASYGDGYFQVGDWHDTLMIREMAGGAALTVRMSVDRFTGKMVVHCHILEHEDEGMMAWIDVTGTEGATYALATTLDPACYSSAFSGGDSSNLTTATVTTTALIQASATGCISIGAVAPLAVAVAALSVPWIRVP